MITGGLLTANDGGCVGGEEDVGHDGTTDGFGEDTAGDSTRNDSNNANEGAPSPAAGEEGGSCRLDDGAGVGDDLWCDNNRSLSFPATSIILIGPNPGIIKVVEEPNGDTHVEGEEAAELACIIDGSDEGAAASASGEGGDSC
jgi:hypothetical protein